MSPLHSQGSPTKGVKIKSGCLTLAISGGQKRAEMPRHPSILGGLQRQARGAKLGVATSPCLLGGLKEEGIAMLPLQSWGSPTTGSKIKSDCLTLAFSGAHKRAEMPYHPCIPRGLQRQARGAKSGVAPHPTFSGRRGGGAERGQKCDFTPAFSGISDKGERNKKWLPHPCLLGGLKEDGIAMSSPPSWGSATNRNEMRSRCLTPAFSGAQRRAEMLHHPDILGGLQRQARGAKSGVPTSPYLLSGPIEGGIATSPLHSRGSGNKEEQNQKWHSAFSGTQKRAELLCHPCIHGDPQQRGAKSKMVALPLPSLGPKTGGKCYITPAFVGFPNKVEQNQRWPRHPCLLGGSKEGAKSYVTLAISGIPNKAEQTQKWLPHPCLLGGLEEGSNATSPLGRQAKGANQE